MAYTDEDIQGFLDSVGGDPASNFKMLLYYADLDEDFVGDEEWSDVCRFAVEQDKLHGWSQDFQERYVQAGGFDEACAFIRADLHDNFILCGIAMHNLGLKPAAACPWVAEAAFNKRAYQGLKDEFALVRFLHWAGHDISSWDEHGMTALHCFASQRYLPGTNPRAVKWLVEHGADVTLVNENGDTPLIYLCAVQGWSSMHTESFIHLVNAGSNPFVEANDGASAYSMLIQLDAAEPQPERAAIIQRLTQVKLALEERAALEELTGIAKRPASAQQVRL